MTLASMYSTEKWGVKQDNKESEKWARLAAEQGYPEAQRFLGALYHSGSGVDKNNILAYMWIYLALKQDIKDTKQYLEIVQKSMTSQQIEEAKKLAEACLTKKYKGC